jgi:hypothetical protein
LALNTIAPANKQETDLEPRQSSSALKNAWKRLSEAFAGERQKLEEQWGRGTDASTEDLRVVLRRYRSFFTRLLEI